MSKIKKTTPPVLLNTVGASYFVSYLYWKYVDSGEKSWTARVSDQTKSIDRHQREYAEMLDFVLQKNPGNLGTNRLGLSGERILEMARELKDYFTKPMRVSLRITGNGFLVFSDFCGILAEINREMERYTAEQSPVFGGDAVILVPTPEGFCRMELWIKGSERGIGRLLSETVRALNAPDDAAPAKKVTARYDPQSREVCVRVSYFDPNP